MDNIPAVIAVTLTGVAMLGAGMLYVIRGEIGKATKDLQPKNGGGGWSDTARIVNQIDTRLTALGKEVQQLHARIDYLHDRQPPPNPTPYRRRANDD